MNTWLVKSEPFKYSWQQFVTDGKARWDGIRNFEARNNLRAMKKGDLCLFYHSNEGKEIVGVAEVVREAYPDPTADEGDWSVVDLAPKKPLAVPVSLATIKADKKLTDIEMLRRNRLSVTKILPAELTHILKLAKTKL